MLEYGYAILDTLVLGIQPEPKVKASMNEIEMQKRLKLAQVHQAEAQKAIDIKLAEARAEAKHRTASKKSHESRTAAKKRRGRKPGVRRREAATGARRRIPLRSRSRPRGRAKSRRRRRSPGHRPQARRRRAPRAEGSSAAAREPPEDLPHAARRRDAAQQAGRTPRTQGEVRAKRSPAPRRGPRGPPTRSPRPRGRRQDPPPPRTRKTDTQTRATQHTECGRIRRANYLRINTQKLSHESRLRAPHGRHRGQSCKPRNRDAPQPDGETRSHSPAAISQAPRDARAAKGTRQSIRAPCRPRDATPPAREEATSRTRARTPSTQGQTAQQATYVWAGTLATRRQQAHMRHRSPQ